MMFVPFPKGRLTETKCTFPQLNRNCVFNKWRTFSKQAYQHLQACGKTQKPVKIFQSEGRAKALNIHRLKKHSPLGCF